MNRFVVSAPRSGLNWVRYCTEHFFGRRTPGKEVLISQERDPGEAFQRSHDALHYTRKNGTRIWQKITASDVNGGKLVLVLRDPLETFSRVANGRIKDFGLYAGNIHLYGMAEPADRAVYYYEDLIARPETMMALFDHLQMEPADGYSKPDLQALTAQWQAVSSASRGTYDVNQSAGGGAMTKDNPTDFKFHQRGLTDVQKAKAWRYLKRILSADEFELLARYAPDAPIKPQTFVQMLLDRLS
jgi:hypothetical protein